MRIQICISPYAYESLRDQIEKLTKSNLNPTIFGTTLLQNRSLSYYNQFLTITQKIGFEYLKKKYFKEKKN